MTLLIDGTTNSARSNIATKMFQDNFELVHVDSPKLRKVSYALRYQIFCVERGFDMDAEDGMEFDEYDKRSIGFLIRHRESDAFVATGRLILADPKRPYDSLPIQKYLTKEQLAPFGLDGGAKVNQTCEISRLGILKSFLKNCKCLSDEVTDKRQALLKTRNVRDLCKLGLYRGIFDFALNYAGTPNCVFSTDPYLLKSFEHNGFKQYSVMCENLDIFGPVTPVYFNIRHMLSDVHDEKPINWAVMTDNGKILEIPQPVFTAA